MPSTQSIVINTSPILALVAAWGSLDRLQPLYSPHSALQIVTLRIMAEDNRATQIGVRRFSKEKAPPTQKIVTG